MQSPQNKIFYETFGLVSQIAEWKSQGLSVVFTNGCFDILHRGHVQYLYDAANLGDKLIVAVNSDNSVKQLNKGDNRPINTEQDRAFILAALEYVSAVTIFDDPTPLPLIEKVKPDVLVKGADYSPSQVIGKDFVESYGGKLVLIPFVEGYSSSKIIQKITGK
ncbi:MAG: D-glycero-beta-D-manno-heptose 1-phosphate adenylyltransferase [Bacteroidia bacterium]